jgi:hypothetical protein
LIFTTRTPKSIRVSRRSKVFVVILGQCTKAVKSALANSGGLDALEVNEDVVGLLARLRVMAFSTGGIQEPRTICYPHRQF